MENKKLNVASQGKISVSFKSAKHVVQKSNVKPRCLLADKLAQHKNIRKKKPTLLEVGCDSTGEGSYTKSLQDVLSDFDFAERLTAKLEGYSKRNTLSMHLQV